MKLGDRVRFANQFLGECDIGTLIASGSNPQGALVWFIQDESRQIHAAHTHELAILSDLSTESDTDPTLHDSKPSETPEKEENKDD